MGFTVSQWEGVAVWELDPTHAMKPHEWGTRLAILLLHKIVAYV
jgi:hypothetical protein